MAVERSSSSSRSRGATHISVTSPAESQVMPSHSQVGVSTFQFFRMRVLSIAAPSSSSAPVCCSWGVGALWAAGGQWQMRQAQQAGRSVGERVCGVCYGREE